MKLPFSSTHPQIEKPGKRYLHIVPTGSSDMKFHNIWSRNCGEMALDERTDARTYAKRGDYVLPRNASGRIRIISNADPL